MKSQWDFGDLFAQPAVRRVLTVSELTLSVRRLLEQHIGEVWVSGEITNLRLQSSGHVYFSIKDSAAQLQCVLFRGEARHFKRELLEDGLRVILQGDLTVYEPRGQYQLRVVGVELQGVGALQAAFEQVKRKLQAEGLFAAERKRPLPRYPRALGVVTSASGAALRDVLHVLQRRHPGLEVIVAPCRVQGQGAADEIASAIRLLNEWAFHEGGPPRVDLILVTRGGGSMEDLWAFNEEVVARAIFESALPVVSAVGHEIDFTISDFVADLRAATPSAAAELITEGLFSSRVLVENLLRRLRDELQERLEREEDRVATLRQRLARAHPRRRLEDRSQLVDDLAAALERCAKQGCRRWARAFEAVLQRWMRLHPSAVCRRRREDLERLQARLRNQTAWRMKELRVRLSRAGDSLRLLSPGQVLERGYSITVDMESGKILRDAANAQPGRRLKTRLHAGEIESAVVSAKAVEPGSPVVLIERDAK